MPSFPIQLKRNGTAAATPSSLLHGEVALNYADGKLFWKDASNVIQSFTFQAYALSSHTHAASDITSGTLDAARLPLATTVAAGAVIVGTGLGVSSGTVSVTYGTSAGTACQGNDSRLSDTRTPTDGSVTTAKIANDAVTYAKIQNVSATDRLLGRSSAGSGDVEEITCTAFGRSLIDDADAAAARNTLSVQPTASPAFTGAATFTAASGGSSVPVTITNEGTGNSFVVNDAPATDSTPFVIDADGRVVIGGSSPFSDAHKLAILGALPSSGATSVAFVQRGTFPSSSTTAAISFISVALTEAASFTLAAMEHFAAAQGTLGSGSSITSQYGFVARSTLTGATNNYGFYSDIASGTGRFNFYANGTAANYFAGTVLIGTTTAFDATGNLQIAAAANPGITICRTAAPLNTNSVAGMNGTAYDGAAYVAGGTINFRAAENWSSTNHGTDIQFRTTPTGSGGSLTETLRLTSAGQLLVTAGSGSSGSYKPGVAVSGDDDTGLQQVGGAGTISIVTQGSERVRVDASGNVLVGTTDANPAGNNVVGTAIASSGYLSITRDSDNPVLINRKTNDGTLTTYQQDGATEGSVSVSGNTVSYNAFCGSHWAQLIDGSRPAILRGTVLETIDEMCEWPGEPKNDRLPRVKVSDTPRSRRVYGVFMAWDEDYAATGDMYATALGAYMVRVSGTVQAGDLLESAGDGTARTQPDDIVRSSTIGKVSSTHRVAEYDDGSYLVPCVLICG